VVARRKKLPPSDYETEYSEDSQGLIKLDKHGDPVKKYEVDPKSGHRKLDKRGNPIPKTTRKAPAIAAVKRTKTFKREKTSLIVTESEELGPRKKPRHQT